jgi:hypothetical protein
MAFYTIPTLLERHLFSGKKATYNRELFEILVQKGAMTTYDLHHELKTKLRKDVKYPAVYLRIRALNRDSLVEVKLTRIAERSRKEIACWGLSPLGLWAATQMSTTKTKAMENCKGIIAGRWKTFAKIYEFTKKRNEDYEKFTKWLNTDKGIAYFLRFFGPDILDDEELSLRCFLQMIVLSFYRPDPSFGSIQLDKSWILPENPLFLVERFASKHPTFGKLKAFLVNLDDPIHEHRFDLAQKQFKQKLIESLGEDTARKLHDMPILTTELPAHDAGMRWTTLVQIAPDSFLSQFGAVVTFKKNQVIVLTSWSEKINPLWKKTRGVEVRSTGDIEYPEWKRHFEEIRSRPSLRLSEERSK